MKNRILFYLTALVISTTPVVAFAGTGTLSGACYPAIDCDAGYDAYGAGAACRKAINTVADCAAAGYPATSNSFSCAAGCYKASSGSGGPTCPTVTFTNVDDDDNAGTPAVSVVVPSFNLVDYNSTTQIFNCATKILKPYWSSGTSSNTLYTNARVGIGTSNPTAASLQIVNSGSGAALQHRIGVQADITESTAGLVNNSAYGLYGAITDSGSGSAIGLYPWLVTDNDDGSAYVLSGTARDNGNNSAYGAMVSAQNNDAGDAYGLYVQSQNNSTGREFGVYVNGADNYFGGRIGVGTTTPVSNVQIGNNVGSGAFDDFDDFQLLLYQGADAPSSYGLGIEGSTLAFNSNNYFKFYTDNTERFGILNSEVRMTGGTDGNPSAWMTHFNYGGNGKNYIRGTTVIGDNGSNLGVGTSTPSHKVHITGNNNTLRLEGTGSYGSGSTLNLGDGDYVHISEPIDDYMDIKSSNFNVDTAGNMSITGHAKAVGGFGKLYRKSGTSVYSIPPGFYAMPSVTCNGANDMVLSCWYSDSNNSPVVTANTSVWGKSCWMYVRNLNPTTYCAGGCPSSYPENAEALCWDPNG